MEISKEQTIKLKEIASKHKLKLILLHGSNVSGLTHPKSDIDIAVLPEGNIELLSLISELNNVFETDKVDISNLRTGNPLLLQTISLKSKLLVGTQEEYNQFQLNTLHKYNDYLPFLKKEKEFVQERIKHHVSTRPTNNN